MIDIHYIQDANLISARFHAIDLDVEALCGELAALLNAPAEKADAALQKVWMAKAEKLEDRLTEVLIHVWPNPMDPVVLSLRALAANVVDRAGQAKARLLLGKGQP